MSATACLLLALLGALALLAWAPAQRGLAAEGDITTLAGTGTLGSAGDGGPPALAQLDTPTAVAASPDGTVVVVSDGNANRVRRLTPSLIVTAAGTGLAGFTGDGGQGAAARVSFPAGVAMQADGGFLFADNDNHRIRRVAPNGLITTVAGTGSPGFSGDGGLATSAQLNDPTDVSITADGGFLIADNDNHRIRKVLNGEISTVAGTGQQSFSGDGGAAAAATLNNPTAVAATTDGGFMIADRANNRIRRVMPGAGGTIATFAGTGAVGGPLGDGAQATAAQIRSPFDLAIASDGAVLIADTLNHRIRRVANGVITTVAGAPSQRVLRGQGAAGCWPARPRRRD